MTIFLFITLHTASAISIYYFFNDSFFKNKQKIEKSDVFKFFIILILAIGMIGNFYLSNYILGL